MNGKQCKMARNGLGWTVHDLADKAGIQAGTISRFERGGDALSSTVGALESALLATGRVRFEGETCVCVAEEQA